VKKYITSSLGVLFLLAFLSMTLLRQYYTQSMPETPQIQAGRTIPIDVNYRKTVYVTSREQRELEAAYIIVGIMGVSFVFFTLFFAKKR
jgi:hypothetical protein